jgi:hypothetical protein
MVTFTVTQGSNGFWIEKIGQDGSLTIVQRAATENDARRMMRVIQERADIIETRNTKLSKNI